ncbi:Clu domain-containing protein [Balamuthia mandrillaris]
MHSELRQRARKLSIIAGNEVEHNPNAKDKLSRPIKQTKDLFARAEEEEEDEPLRRMLLTASSTWLHVCPLIPRYVRGLGARKGAEPAGASDNVLFAQRRAAIRERWEKEEEEGRHSRSRSRSRSVVASSPNFSSSVATSALTSLPTFTLTTPEREEKQVTNEKEREREIDGEVSEEDDDDDEEGDEGDDGESFVFRQVAMEEAAGGGDSSKDKAVVEEDDVEGYRLHFARKRQQQREQVESSADLLEELEAGMYRAVSAEEVLSRMRTATLSTPTLTTATTSSSSSSASLVSSMEEESSNPTREHRTASYVYRYVTEKSIKDAGREEKAPKGTKKQKGEVEKKKKKKKKTKSEEKTKTTKKKKSKSVNKTTEEKRSEEDAEALAKQVFRSPLVNNNNFLKQQHQPQQQHRLLLGNQRTKGNNKTTEKSDKEEANEKEKRKSRRQTASKQFFALLSTYTEAEQQPAVEQEKRREEGEDAPSPIVSRRSFSEQYVTPSLLTTGLASPYESDAEGFHPEEEDDDDEDDVEYEEEAEEDELSDTDDVSLQSSEASDAENLVLSSSETKVQTSTSTASSYSSSFTTEIKDNNDTPKTYIISNEEQDKEEASKHQQKEEQEMPVLNNQKTVARLVRHNKEEANNNNSLLTSRNSKDMLTASTQSHSDLNEKLHSLSAEELRSILCELEKEDRGIRYLLREKLGLDKGSEQNQQMVGVAAGKSSTLRWNERFQKAVHTVRSLPIDAKKEVRMRAYEKLASLAHDFVASATSYGKIIIAEVYLPPHQKTIQPILGSGVAGGEKYLVQDIYFKFALNHKGLYDGTEEAAKVAANELLAMGYLFNLGLEELHYPMMVLVDYRGFRLQAMSRLPISSQTLKYGSPDAGRTVHYNPKIHRSIKQAGMKLNLKAHKLGPPDNAVSFYTPVDLEAHIGTDGRIYLLDVARVFPPETPKPGIKCGHLFRLLRPELVKKYPIPLCSDAFSYFILEHNPMEHNSEVAEATAFLENELVPGFTSRLRRHEPSNYLLIESMHQWGINVRYLGRIRHLMGQLIQQETKGEDTQHKNKEGKEEDYAEMWNWYLLFEMVTRVIKSLLRQVMRRKIRALVQPRDKSLKKEVVRWLNLIFGNNEESKEVWEVNIKQQLLKKYDGQCLSSYERSLEFDLKKYISVQSPFNRDGRCLLFSRVVRKVGLEFSKTVQSLFTNSQVFNYTYPLEETDLKRIVEKVKTTSMVHFAQGWVLSAKAATITNDKDECRHLNKLAVDHFTKALRCGAADNPTTLCNLADALLVSGGKKNLERAEHFYTRAVECEPENTSSLFKYALFLEHVNRLDEAEDHFLRALELTSSSNFNELSNDFLRTYADFLFYHLNAYEEAEWFYIYAIKVPPPDPFSCNNYACMLLGMADDDFYWNSNDTSTQSSSSSLISPSLSKTPTSSPHHSPRLSRRTKEKEKEKDEYDDEGYEEDERRTRRRKHDCIKIAEFYFKQSVQMDMEHPQHLLNYALFIQRYRLVTLKRRTEELERKMKHLRKEIQQIKQQQKEEEEKAIKEEEEEMKRKQRNNSDPTARFSYFRKIRDTTKEKEQQKQKEREDKELLQAEEKERLLQKELDADQLSFRKYESRMKDLLRRAEQLQCQRRASSFAQTSAPLSQPHKQHRQRQRKSQLQRMKMEEKKRVKDLERQKNDIRKMATTKVLAQLEKDKKLNQRALLARERRFRNPLVTLQQQQQNK